MKNKPNLIKSRLSTSWGKISEDAKRKKTMNRISCFLCNIISKSNIHEIWEVGEAGKFLNNGIFFFFLVIWQQLHIHRSKKLNKLQAEILEKKLL